MPLVVEAIHALEQKQVTKHNCHASGYRDGEPSCVMYANPFTDPLPDPIPNQFPNQFPGQFPDPVPCGQISPTTYGNINGIANSYPNGLSDFFQASRLASSPEEGCCLYAADFQIFDSAAVRPRLSPSISFTNFP